LASLLPSQWFFLLNWQKPLILGKIIPKIANLGSKNAVVKCSQILGKLHDLKKQERSVITCVAS
jgi:hypothetical protein